MRTWPADEKTQIMSAARIRSRSARSSAAPTNSTSASPRAAWARSIAATTSRPATPSPSRSCCRNSRATQTILALFRKEASILNHLFARGDRALPRLRHRPGDRPPLSGDGVRRRRVAGRHVRARPDAAGGCAQAAGRGWPPGLPRPMRPASSTATSRPTTSSCPAARSSRAKIIDFGIARSASVGGETLLGGFFAGKYNFVSPEQLGMFGGEVTERSDIYSLGLVIAAALRGKPLDMSGSQVDVIEKRRVGAGPVRHRPSACGRCWKPCCSPIRATGPRHAGDCGPGRPGARHSAPI